MNHKLAISILKARRDHEQRLLDLHSKSRHGERCQIKEDVIKQLDRSIEALKSDGILTTKLK